METTEYEDNTRAGRGESSGSPDVSKKKKVRLIPLMIFMFLMGVGNVGGPLLQRLYYIHGGSHKWLISFLLSAGSPTIIVPIIFTYMKARAKGENPLLHPRLILSAVFMGVLYGLDNFMYSAGLAYIPVSTSSILISTQLAFTAIFAFIVVRQKFTFYSLSSVVLMTMGTAALALHTSSDRPEGVTRAKYFQGFLLTLGAAALWGFMVPFIERSYRKSKRSVDTTIVMQYQLLMGLGGMAICLIGMGINKEYTTIPREARDYTVGRTKYIIVLVADAVLWQIAFIGILGVVHNSSALFCGVFGSLLVPITEVVAVATYKDKFTGEKGMSLALTLWGFTTYFVGEYKMAKRTKPAAESAINSNVV